MTTTVFQDLQGAHRTSVRPPSQAWNMPEQSNSGANDRYPLPFLPIDTPPRYPAQGSATPQTMRGLIFDANLKGVAAIAKQFTQFIWGDKFLSPSDAGPAAIGTRIGYSINQFSPASHRMARARMSSVNPVAVGSQKYASSAKGYNRMRGRVVTQPYANPQWLSLTGRTVG